MFIFIMVLVVLIQIILLQFKYFKIHKRKIRNYVQIIIILLGLSAISKEIISYGFESGLIKFGNDVPFYVIFGIMNSLLQNYLRNRIKDEFVDQTKD